MRVAKPRGNKKSKSNDVIINDNVCSFFEHDHKLDEQLALTENFKSALTPVGFIGIELYPHQSTVVQAMLDIEDKQVLNVTSKDFRDYSTQSPVVVTSAMVLSEPFGSGKTIELLALIEHRPIPRAFPTHLNSVTIEITSNSHWTPTQFQHEVTRRFTGQNVMIRPTLIVVGSSVLVQWEQQIQEYTALKVFTIGDFYKLKKFIALYEAGEINKYNIILLKNGKVAGNLGLGIGKDMCSLITAVAVATKGRIWSRVIYDDFDTISIPSNTHAINALFTIYVSATTKTDTVSRTQTVTYKSLVDCLQRRGIPLNLVTRDKTLFSNFNVRNTIEFTEISTSITKIKGYRYVYANPDDNYIRLLGAMGEQDALNVMEMLNGDAISTAAETLGIKTNSVADIFQKMLDKKYDRYMHDQKVLELLDELTVTVQDLPEHEEGKRHSATEIDSIRSSINRAKSPHITYYSDALDKLFDEMTAEYTIAKEEDGRAINRVIENIKEGMCQVCCLPLEEFDTFIVRCCGLIVCDECGIKGNRIKNRYDYKTKSYTVCGSCANCKSTVYLHKDLIFVDRNFDMETLLQAKGDEEPEVEEIIVAAATEDSTPEPEIKNPKLKAIKQIIRREIPADRESISIKIPHLLHGRKDIAPSGSEPMKALIFANFNETLNMVENFFVEQGIEFLRLGGTFQEKADTVKKFKTYGQALIINSQQNCAGLNIQFATDLIYFHKITNPDIESQVAGRAQRIGRVSNLNIHYLAYKNEKDLI